MGAPLALKDLRNTKIPQWRFSPDKILTNEGRHDIVNWIPSIVKQPLALADDLLPRLSAFTANDTHTWLCECRPSIIHSKISLSDF
jgi:hypothetical protein